MRYFQILFTINYNKNKVEKITNIKSGNIWVLKKECERP
jgi:hypothetical protein